MDMVEGLEEVLAEIESVPELQDVAEAFRVVIGFLREDVG